MANREQRRKAEVARRQQDIAQQQRAALPQEPVGPPPTALQILQQQSLWSGPIPSPEDLEVYERVHEGLAERIVVMAERQIDMTVAQQEHRIGVESKHMSGLNRRADVGLWMAFILALVVLVGGMMLVYEDHDEAGTAIITMDLIGLVSVFIYGRWDQARRERQG